MRKPIIIGITAAVIIATAIIWYSLSNATTEPEDFETLANQYFTRDSSWTLLPSTSVFQTYVKESDTTTEDGKQVFGRVILEIDPKIDYTAVRSDDSTVVVYPTFTASAYTEPGFYTYYRGECDETCLTIPIQNNFAQSQANPNAIQAFRLLDYPVITDVDIDKDPSILAKYDKIIMLHSEYVTKRMFDAITGHPNVIYLYPNALYAEVKSDYEKNTITLIRGHNYPSVEIRNGFNWEFDNSQLEYDRDCKKMEFYKVSNGWMLNCWPENTIHKSLNFLETIKDL